MSNLQGSSLQGRAVSGAKYLISSQLLTRIFTFSLNTVVLRHVSPEVFGAAFQLQLITNLTLYFSRESVRRTFARSGEKDGNVLAWMAVFPIGMIASMIVGWFWLNGSSADELNVEHFTSSVLLTLFANLVELLGEPAYVHGAQELNFRQRFFVESGSVLCMCVVLFFSVVFFKLQLLGWALGQLAFSLFSSIAYYVAFVSQNDWKKVLPSRLYPSSAKLKLWAGFQWQAVQQLFLQEGEKVLMKMTANLVNQGLYSVVANLGSLLVRSVFLPLDEVFYAYFARLLQQKDAQKEAKNVLQVLIRLFMTVGAFIVALGPPMSFFVLDLIYGSRMSESSAPDILKVYCLYVSLLGLNGITEAFVRSAITPEQQYVLNMLLIGFSIAQGFVSFFLLRWGGAIGLVYANCFGIVLRLLYSVYFISNYFEKKENKLSISHILPSWQMLAVLTSARFVLTSFPFCDPLHPRLTVMVKIPALSCWVHAFIGGAFFLTAVVCVYVFDRAFVNDVRNIWKTKQN